MADFLMQQMDLFSLVWIVLILMFLIPVVKQRLLEASRSRLLRRIESKRGARVITMIHRQEGLSFLGLPFARYMTLEDSEQVLRAIRLTPDDAPIDIILHTPGGLVLAATQIANAIKKHPAEVRVLIPHYAMSGGTLISLAADRIIMDENAVLGPVDPQLGSMMKMYPAASLLSAVERKGEKKVDDETLILADQARKAMKQLHSLVCSLLEGKMRKQDIDNICSSLTEGKWTHDYPLKVEDLRRLNLNVETGLPGEIYQLMNLYPQPMRVSPTVEFIHEPYRKHPPKAT